MNTRLTSCVTACIGMAIILQISCTNNPPAEKAAEPAKKEMSQSEMIERGKYLVTTVGCNDCHTTKKFSPQGMSFDSSKYLCGHPADAPLPPLDKNAIKPGYWITFAPDLTAMVGPWGISYTANLTPDSATGIGSWTADVFIKSLRTGKHLGQDGGRPILPPMPWQSFAQMGDEDLKSIFAYLKSIPAISNKVPSPVSPADVAKMK